MYNQQVTGLPYNRCDKLCLQTAVGYSHIANQRGSLKTLLRSLNFRSVLKSTIEILQYNKTHTLPRARTHKCMSSFTVIEFVYIFM